MTPALTALAVLTAVTAAARSTWSPCGLSMLSTVTPMAERARGRRWWLTVCWFVAGALAGGLALGALAGLGALVVALLSPAPAVALAVASAAALAAAAMDLGVVGAPLPHHRRQVDETWLDQYRGWVYGLGFGAQIGSGLATYIMTAAVYLTVVLAALTGEPLLAVGIGALFGLVRGLMILLGVRLADPSRLRAFHARFEALRAPVRRAMVVVEVVVALIAAVALPAPASVVAVGAVAVVGGALVVRSRASDPFGAEDVAGGAQPARVGA